MQLRVFKTFWGYSGPWQSKLSALHAGGFDGVEARLPLTHSERREAREFLDRCSLDYIAVLFTGGGVVPQQQRSIADHLYDLEMQLAQASGMEPLMINVLAGNDRWSLAQQVDFFGAALEIVEQYSIPFGFETHRSRALSTPWGTLDLIRQLPEMRFTSDISHWVVGCERLLDDPADDLQPFIERVDHLQARVGYDQGPQVPHPFAPEYAAELAFHQGFWESVWRSQRQRGFQLTTLTPEFGPDGYLQKQPFSQVPVADLDELNASMALHESRHFDAFLTTDSQAEVCDRSS